MEESGSTPQINEDVWSTWFAEIGGIYWTVKEKIPEAARVPWNNYYHYRNNPSPESPPRLAEAARLFKEATGFDAEEVYQFKLSLKAR
ncbi:hypothetical protein KKG51_04485 [Patescibacteria group bacterium]|nr:hypothetical protein [Patescibacteria group bacterium]